MERRKLLKLLALVGASSTVGLSAVSLKKAVAADGISWGYVGEGSPEEWGDLSSTYAACRTGSQQSPINLQGAIGADLETIEISYKPVPLSILNTGHTIQVNAPTGNSIQLDGESFDLLQFHFHDPSEHTVESRAYPMELHFVHANAKGELAVLSVFLEEGEENMSLAPVWKAMPNQKTEAQTISGAQVDITKLLPSNRSLFRYFGSLTTPPCSEIVKWVVFKEPISVSAAQIAKFKEIFPLNARPVQPLERRFILQSN
ncbi:MAG: carbonic anhydrase [Phormidesmis sp.]